MGEDNLGIELINKDTAINDLICVMSELSIEPYAQERIIGCLLNQKTAYDTEKVIEKLEVLLDLVSGTHMFAVRQAIEIVRRGGV